MNPHRRNVDVKRAHPVAETRLSRRRLVAAAAASTGAQVLPGAVSGPGGRRLGGPGPVAAAAQEIAPVSRFYFASTGHNLAEPFLSAWQNLGGEAGLGPPLSEERYATGAGGVLQTFADATALGVEVLG